MVEYVLGGSPTNKESPLASLEPRFKGLKFDDNDKVRNVGLCQVCWMRFYLFYMLDKIKFKHLIKKMHRFIRSGRIELKLEEVLLYQRPFSSMFCYLNQFVFFGSSRSCRIIRRIMLILIKQKYCSPSDAVLLAWEIHFFLTICAFCLYKLNCRFLPHFVLG